MHDLLPKAPENHLEQVASQPEPQSQVSVLELAAVLVLGQKEPPPEQEARVTILGKLLGVL